MIDVARKIQTKNQSEIADSATDDQGLMKISPSDALILENQVCFPLYAASRLMMQLYKPHLDELGLTYPQYLVMMVLWQYGALNAAKIGKLLFLDAATLNQVLSNLSKLGYISRDRSEGKDARVVNNKLTPKGRALRKKAEKVPHNIACGFADNLSEVVSLRPKLFRLIQLLNDLDQVNGQR